MKDVMGLINLHEPEEQLKDIAQHRPLAAVPFGGRYRLIDFTLSNMVNSGISTVGILVNHNYRALMDHLRSGKDWDLARKRDGLFILPPASIHQSMGICRGDMEHFYSHLDYIHKSAEKYVIITGSRMVCNVDFNKVFRFYQDAKADIVVLYHEAALKEDDLLNFTMLSALEDGRVMDMEVSPGRAKTAKVSMEMYLLEKRLLEDIIDNCIARGEYDFTKDGIIKNIGRLRIFGYRHTGYLAKINSIQNYYRHNMDLLDQVVWQELFFQAGPVYTKVKDEAPSVYREHSAVHNSLIANGCYIEGQVENSILFRGVRVHKGAYVKNSIIMQKGEIGEDAVVENVICDKDVSITYGKQLKGAANYPLTIKKGTVI